MRKRYAVRSQGEGNVYRRLRLSLGLRIQEVATLLECSTATVYYAEGVVGAKRRDKVGTAMQHKYSNLLMTLLLERKLSPPSQRDQWVNPLQVQQNITPVPVTAIQAVQIMQPTLTIADIPATHHQLVWETAWL